MCFWCVSGLPTPDVSTGNLGLPFAATWISMSVDGQMAQPHFRPAPVQVPEGTEAILY